MKKLTLRVEDLQIDSFRTADGRTENGTVYGEQCTCWTNCTCPGCPTCDGSCGGSCGATCAGTCGATCEHTCDCPGTGWGEYTCENSCHGGWTCEYTCAGYVTGGWDQHCVLC